MPQWQGGGNPTYQLGARLLAWLAPESDDPLLEVPITPPEASSAAVEDGIFAKAEVLAQAREARRLIDQQAPDRIVTFGGDCSVSLAPFAYLAEKYQGEVAALWIDAHTDFTTPSFYGYAHGYPARVLLGDGDPDLTALAKVTIPGDRLVYVGVGKAELGEAQLAELESFGATVFDPSELTPDFGEVLSRIRQTGASKLLVHFDVDALDPQHFRSQLFNHPDGSLAEQFRGIATGRMTLDEVVRLLHEVNRHCEVVGLTFAEHLPWDDQHMRNAMARMPILS